MKNSGHSGMQSSRLILSRVYPKINLSPKLFKNRFFCFPPFRGRRLGRIDLSAAVPRTTWGQPEARASYAL